jgi:hypothetical protein
MPNISTILWGSDYDTLKPLSNLLCPTLNVWKYKNLNTAFRKNIPFLFSDTTPVVIKNNSVWRAEMCLLESRLTEEAMTELNAMNFRINIVLRDLQWRLLKMAAECWRWFRVPIVPLSFT